MHINERTKPMATSQETTVQVQYNLKSANISNYTMLNIYFIIIACASI